jgi:hypothetical protein
MIPDDLTPYLERAAKIIGERTPEEIQYDDAVVENLSSGMSIKKAIAAANRQYPDEALKLEARHWDDVATRYEYLRQHKILLRRLGIQ